jgi:predicted peptidase
VHESDTDDQDREYLLYVPGEYLENPGEPWPLVLFLHGYAASGGDFDWLARQALPTVARTRPYRSIMAAPHARSTNFQKQDWAWLHSAGYLKGFVDHVSKRVRVDPARIYVIGSSWGATGA